MDDTHPALVRSPIYALRALVGATVTAAAVVSLLVFERGLLGIRSDLASIQAGWPGWLLTGGEVAFTLTIVAALVGTNVVLFARGRRRRGLTLDAAAVAAILLGAVVGNLVLAAAPSDALADALDDASQEGLGNDLLAALIAVLTVSSVWIGPRLRPWAVGAVTAAVGVSIVGGSVSIITLPFDVGVGMFAGALVALGVKTDDRTPTPDTLRAACRRAGIVAQTVERASVDARGSVPWLVCTVADEALFVKSLGADQRAADLLFRLYRAVRLRRAGDHRPHSSLRRALEHEAFLSLAAHGCAVRTPRLRAIGEVGTDGMFAAYERIEGTSLDRVDPSHVSDSILAASWHQVAALRRARIAHRDLRLANILVDEHDTPWIIDFGFAELAAEDSLLARDAAELLASTAAVVGPDRAVAAAIVVLGPDAIADALPWLQPLALSAATRDRIGGAEPVADLRSIVAAATGADTRGIQSERVERVNPVLAITLASVVGLGLVVAGMLDTGGPAESFEAWRATWGVAAIAASTCIVLGAGLGIRGAVPVRLSVGSVVLAQLAASCTNALTAAKAGGAPTSIRFLEKHDLGAPTAASAVGLTTVAGAPLHFALLVGFAGVAAHDADLPLPDSRLAAITAIVILLSGGVMLLPAGRGLLTSFLVPAIRSGLAGASITVTAPARALVVAAGAGAVTVGSMVTMISALAMLGGDPPFVSAAVVYLAGTAIAAAAPTPGSVGATEAALIAGYTAIGVDVAIAVPAVLVFRLLTFWLPLPFGWLAGRRLRHRRQL